MLESLNIRNLALIEDLTIDFRRGFNVLSGETGAGKSIIIGALGLVLGEKTSSDMVRSGADMANVEALFDITGNQAVQDFLSASGTPAGSGEVLVRRTISREGKSRSFVNNSLANMNMLKELGALLVDIHGQHEHQALFRISSHISLLDSFAGLEEDAAGMSRFNRRIRELEQQIEAFNMDEREKQRRMELNSFAINEIDAAELQAQEEEELEDEARVLNNFEKIYATLDSAYSQLQSSGALGMSKAAARELESISEHDNRAASFHSRAQDIVFSLEDLNDELRSYKDSIAFSPQRQEEVNARLALIQDLKRKYGGSVSEIIAYRDQCEQENESITSGDMQRAELEEELERVREEARQAAFALSNSRQEQARALEKAVMAELAFLGMDKTAFMVDIRYIRDPEGFIEVSGEQVKLFENGIDYVEFLIAPNPGEPPRPLRKIASGGEISRIMLALKTVLTSGHATDTLVFDEVDAGIGGVTASAVGKKLKEVAAADQVLCITHLPQIAAMADHHIMVVKSVQDERTRTEVRHLAMQERMEELARMMGGESVNATTLEQARHMIEAAAKS